MTAAYKNARVYRDGKFVAGDIVIRNGRPDFSADLSGSRAGIENCIVIPGLADVHVHLREPGFFYKESIRTGTLAAAHGGFTAVCAMPNLSPVPDGVDHLEEERRIIRSDAVVRVFPYGAVTVGEQGEALSDMAGMAPYVCGFSDDGRGVQSEKRMREAMTEAARLGKVLAAHCEVNDLLRGGYIHDGEYARRHGHRGICSASEYEQVDRDLRLAKQTGCAYHVCHVSTAESVALIRRAKADGVNVTCETAPHYLILTEDDLQEDGRFKMNPPLRTRFDREALIEGLLDGTIDMIATDHAPHGAEEKSRGLAGSPMGVVGLECAFALMYTEFVQPGILSLEKLIELMAVNPKKRFGIDTEEDFTVFELAEPFTVDPETFLSKGRATPFAGRKVYGKCLLTVCRGTEAYSAGRG